MTCVARISEFPDQCLMAWDQAADLQISAHYRRARSVVVLGMGGSAQGGDLVSALAASENSIPMVVNRQYSIPAFVDEHTIVIACSYSGNTEETLSAFQQALDRGAMPLAIATGGRLEQMAAKHAIPFSRITYATVPRAAPAHSMVRVLSIVQQLGLISEQHPNLVEAVDVMKAWQEGIGPAAPSKDNLAKGLALRCQGRLPVVYGSGALGIVAMRWKGQLNENAKSWSFFEEMPELNHNAVMGTRLPADLVPLLHVLMLTSSHDHPRNRVRFDTTAALLRRDGVSVETVTARGESALAQMLSLIHLGDFVSYYLAMLNGVDPTDTGAIEWLKKRIAEAG